MGKIIKNPVIFLERFLSKKNLLNKRKINDREIKMNTIQPLDIELVKELWSKTYNKEGKPDWSHIFPYYAENIHFQDSIQSIHGIQEFTKMCDRLTKRCKQLNMDIYNISQNENIILFEWKMQMIFRRSPSTPIYGATCLTLNENGIIIKQRDYYDLWGDIFNGIPGFKKLYRIFMRKFFG